MARYKEVEPFIKWLEKEIEQFGEPNISIRPVAYGSENALRSVLNKMKELPESDVAEVKHGEWIEIKGEKETLGTLTCSCCQYIYARLYPKNYCPHCGAKMNLSELPTD